MPERKKLLCQLSKFSIDLKRICCSVGIMNVILILSRPYSIQGREPYLCHFITKALKLACIQTFTDPFFQTLYDDSDH